VEREEIDGTLEDNIDSKAVVRFVGIVNVIGKGNCI
jgi:hypothetical protein